MMMAALLYKFVALLTLMISSAFIPPNTSGHPALRNKYATKHTGFKPLPLACHPQITGGLTNKGTTTAGFTGPITTGEFATSVPTTGLTTGGPSATTGMTTGLNTGPTTNELTTGPTGIELTTGTSPGLSNGPTTNEVATGPTNAEHSTGQSTGSPTIGGQLDTIGQIKRGKPTIGSKLRGSKVSKAVKPFAIHFTKTKKSWPEVVKNSLWTFFKILDFGMEFDENNPGTMPQDYPIIDALYQSRDLYTYTKMAWEYIEQVETSVILKFLAQIRRSVKKSAKKVKGDP